jgi:integrase
LAAFKAELKANKLKARSVNLNLSRVGAFLSWAEAHGMVDANPMSKAIRASVDEDDIEVIEPYTRAEIQSFIDRLQLDLNDPHFEARHWIVALLSVTGGRLNEIASLRTVDVQLDAGVTYIDIGREGGRQTKNKSSNRRVPIIKALAEPLMEYAAGLVAANEERLFPMWAGRRPGMSAGHWLRGWLAGKVHRIRHSVATELRDAGIQETLAAEVLGHTTGTTLSYGLYSGRSPLPTLLDVLERSVGTAYRWPNLGANVPGTVLSVEAEQQ